MEHLIKLCVTHDVTPNEIAVLYSISIKHKVLESIKRDVTLRNLINKNLIELKDKSAILTTKGKSVLDQANSLFLKRYSKRDLTKEPDFIENVTKFRELWPKAVLTIQGKKYPLRSPEKEIINSFNKFFTDYPETEWSTIFSVTHKYIRSHVEDTNYMMVAKNFVYKIDKNGPKSKLAEEIILLDSYDLEEDIPDFMKPRSV
jgi:hypothetical protein